MNRTEFLKDNHFLKMIDTLPVKQQYLKLTILDWNEESLNEIQGKAISGSLNIDGKSSLRRTANFTMFAQEDKNDLTAINQELSINRKAKLEIGILNTVPQYIYEFFNEIAQKTDFATINYQQKYGDIIWFPLGIFIIFDPNITHQLSGVTISITLKDKMCLLNGDAGGVIPATVNFSQREDEYGVITVPTMRQTIYQLVNHFGLENASKIIIDDLQDRIKQVVQYIGSEPAYLGRKEREQANIFVTRQEAEREYDQITEIQYGMDIGYIMTDFTYPGVLECNGGETVTSVIDKIIAALGNYEYFYDVYGNFHFQQIKNYLNKTYTTTVLEDPNYDLDLTGGKSVYTFDDTKLITTVANAPKYSNIKNDFIVWGVRKNTLDIQIPIRYHLAIDKKPQIGQTHYARLYLDDDGNYRAAADFYFLASSGSGNPVKTTSVKVDDYYINTTKNLLFKYQKKLNIISQQVYEYTYEWVEQKPPKENTIWRTETTAYMYNGDSYSENEEEHYPLIQMASDNKHITVDWREQLYYQGIQALNTGSDMPYYFTQLLNEWPKLFNLKEQDFNTNVKNNMSQIDYWLDFIEDTAETGQYSVNNIGRRSMVVAEDQINCVFEQQIPDIVYIDLGLTDEEKEEQRLECMAKGQEYSQLTQNKFSLLAIGGTQNSCYQRITELLYQYTNMNETIQISAIPIFYLEPNTRITVRDDASGVIGDYMIDSISLPLDVDSVMSLNCYKCLQKI